MPPKKATPLAKITRANSADTRSNVKPVAATAKTTKKVAKIEDKKVTRGR